MSLNAHTNLPGTYIRNDVYFGKDVNAEGGATIYPFSAEQSYSFKDRPVSSDHKHPTDYRRTVRARVNDVPHKIIRLDTFDHKTWIERGYNETSMAYYCGTDLGRRFVDFEGLEQNSVAQANVKALNDLGGDKQQAFVDLMESRQTFNMLLSRSMQMFKAINALKHGRPGEALQTLFGSRRDLLTGKTLSNGFLEYRYGWEPLLNSIYGYQELAKADSGHEKQLSGKGFSRFQVDREILTPGDDGRKVVHKYRGKVKTEYKGTIKQANLKTANDLGMLNPAAVGWEIIPYSFVLDWFIPVGDVLEAYTATSGLEDVYGYTSTTVDKSITDQMLYKDIPRYRKIGQQGQHTELGYTFVRKAHGVKTPELFGETDPFGLTNPKAASRQSRGYAAAALIRGLRK